MKAEKFSWGYSVVTNDINIKLTLKNNDMELSGELSVHGHQKSFDNNEFIEMLKGLEIQGKIDFDNVMRFCAAVVGEGQIKDVALIRGIPPVPGRDSQLKFMVPMPPAAMRTNSIICVTENQLIAQLIPPTAGTPGTTLTGVSLPTTPGKTTTITLGVGAQWRAGCDPGVGYGEVIATTAGRLVYNPEIPSICVYEQLIIEGDADAKCGDIDFIGAIEIHGDVKIGRRIKAGKYIKITGNVESSFLEANGNIDIGGGVSGKENGLIKAGGNVTARYVDICNIECRGNLSVKREIVDSRIFVGGYIDVSSGAIIGGRLLALGGIEAKMIGSPVGITTSVTSGKCFLSERRIEQLRARAEELKKRIAEIAKQLDHYVKNPVAVSFLNAAEKQQVQDLSKEFTDLNEKLELIPSAITTIRKQVIPRANPLITVEKMIGANVEIILENVSVTLNEPIRQCISIVKNSMTNGLRNINRIKLTDDARKVEQDFARADRQRAAKSG